MRSLFLLTLALIGCSAQPSRAPAPAPESGSWSAADPLFHSEPRWLGGDGAYSIDLGNERTLWLFGDSFVARTSGATRKDSVMVRNSVAVQTGRDPSRASMAFALPDGEPRSFFEERGDRWHWPAGGVRIDAGPLVVFLSVLRKTTGGLGFASDGWRVARVDDPSGPPATWAMTWLEPPKTPFDAVVGSAVVRKDGYVVALAPRAEGIHAAYLARFREADIAKGTVVPEWWTGAARGWVAQAALDGTPETVIDDAGSEASLHFDARRARWVHVASRGFGATTIAVRTAPALEGPWSAPEDVFTPPESTGARPFVYAAKAHAELDAGGDLLVVTYATNSFDFGDLFSNTALYWPHFARLRVP
jgi:Domain of unknown function (DUF4185)